MMPITEEVHAFLTANAAAQIQRDDEYLDPADGLLHCKTCHGLRQTVIPAPGGTGFLRPRCLCLVRVLRKNSAKQQKNTLLYILRHHSFQKPSDLYEKYDKRS